MPGLTHWSARSAASSFRSSLSCVAAIALTRSRSLEPARRSRAKSRADVREKKSLYRLVRTKANPLRLGSASTLSSRGVNHVLERAQSRPRRVDEHRHVAGLVLILPHFGVGGRDLRPGEHLRHAGV